MNKHASPLKSPFKPGSHRKIYDGPLSDPYQAHAKLSEPCVCKECRAIYREGRWQWGAADARAAETTCPACLRIREHQPAGYVTMEGEFMLQHKDELLQLIRHLEQREKAEHPLQQIMGIEERPQKLLVTTTDTHLARGIGRALEQAFHGKSEYSFSKVDHLLRARWQRA